MRVGTQPELTLRIVNRKTAKRATRLCHTKPIARVSGVLVSRETAVRYGWNAYLIMILATIPMAIPLALYDGGILTVVFVALCFALFAVFALLYELFMLSAWARLQRDVAACRSQTEGTFPALTPEVGFGSCHERYLQVSSV